MGTVKNTVFLGFEDELITPKYFSQLNNKTNKIGGKPNWVVDKQLPNPSCQICGLVLPLIVQVYAPLERSEYHRTLYLFGCVNPCCWNKSESWVCLRSQVLSTNTDLVETNSENSTFDWCEGAEDWEDLENGNEVYNHNKDFDRESANINHEMTLLEITGEEEMPLVGALSDSSSTIATAEIEEDEEGIVTIETPTTAEINVAELFTPDKSILQVPKEPEFLSIFISVGEEEAKDSSPLEFDCSGGFLDEKLNSTKNKSIEMDVNNCEVLEKYEKTTPAHGDKLFHSFISRIQRHPGQILRYIRDGGLPLFLYPIGSIPQQCQHCGGELVYELQILPTLIARLQLVGSGTGHIEFGTVFVLACKQSCWASNDTFRSEYVLVQREM